MNKLDEQNSAVEAYIGALLAADIAAVQCVSAVAPSDPARRGAAVPENFITPRAALSGQPLNFMSFKVGGVNFALDTAQVKTVIPFPARGVDFENGRPMRLAAIGHRPALPIVDMRRQVFPEGHVAHSDPRPYGFLILLSMDELALACDDLDQLVRVTGDQIQWRRERHPRPWLAGMLSDSKCAVLDVQVWRTLTAAPQSQH